MTDSRHEALAAHIGCTVADVEAAFGNLLGFALWAAKRSETGIAKREAKNMRRLARKLDGESSGFDLTDARDDLLFKANVAEHFTDRRAYPATKGRNERARVVAYAVARVFVATERNIGKGTSQLNGDPTSKFGQAVKQALEIYGIQDGWRGPAKEAAAEYGNTN